MTPPTMAGSRRAEGQWLSVSAAARALGVSPSTLRLWASEGRVPHVRTAGGHRRFDPEALREWLARQPTRTRRPNRRRAVQIERHPEVAAILRGRIGRIGELVETLVEGPAEIAYRRLSATERAAVVGSWIELLAQALDSGSLADALERSETYGRGHGLAGSSAEVTLGGTLALERAMTRALSEDPDAVARETRGVATSAMGQMTVRVATAWAAAVAGRAGRT